MDGSDDDPRCGYRGSAKDYKPTSPQSAEDEIEREKLWSRSGLFPLGCLPRREAWPATMIPFTKTNGGMELTVEVMKPKTYTSCV